MTDDIAAAAKQDSIFRWETLRVIRPRVLRYKEPVHGFQLEVELITGSRIEVFRSDDGQFFFCHGLTFGGKDAPGGAISPFSGSDVAKILSDFFVRIEPETAAVEGDKAIWHDADGSPMHSAILTKRIVTEGENRLDELAEFRTKNGKFPETTETLRKLTDGPESYGEAYFIYRHR